MTHQAQHQCSHTFGRRGGSCGNPATVCYAKDGLRRNAEHAVVKTRRFYWRCAEHPLPGGEPQPTQ